MGLSLEFYAGDAAIIGADFAAVEWEGIRDGTRAIAYADFSLHLSPSDLDTLCKVVAEYLGAPPLLLNDCLIRAVGAIGQEGGADVVDPAWVRMVAALDESAAAALTAQWIKRVGADCGQQLEVAPEAVGAVWLLIRLCQQAVRERADVVHVWYL